MKMRAARMYGYKQPLRLEEIPVPTPGPEEVLVKVGGAGMCRTDFQLIDGYFDTGLSMDYPITPGHEIAGWVDGVGAEVPASAGLSEGDQIVVFGSWGEGACRQCHEGNEQLCAHGTWAGFGLHGGYQEYLPVHYRHLIKMPSRDDLFPDNLAPAHRCGAHAVPRAEEAACLRAPRRGPYRRGLRSRRARQLRHPVRQTARRRRDRRRIRAQRREAQGRQGQRRRPHDQRPRQGRRRRPRRARKAHRPNRSRRSDRVRRGRGVDPAGVLVAGHRGCDLVGGTDRQPRGRCRCSPSSRGSTRTSARSGETTTTSPRCSR